MIQDLSQDSRKTWVHQVQIVQAWLASVLLLPFTHA